MAETPTERNRRIFEEATDAGEPVFVIRAKDKYAVAGIEHYGAVVAIGEGDDFDDDFGIAIGDVLREVRAWRRANPGCVKTPDLRPGK